MLLLVLALLSGVPDTSKIIRLVGTSQIAHGCPISKDIALTNRHVIVRESSSGPSWLYYTWSTPDGAIGVIEPQVADTFRDLAWIKSAEEFRGFYSVASEAPKVEEEIYFMSYDFTSDKKAFGARVIKAKVVRILGAHLIYSPAGPGGSSGSCVLNSKGEVVAINSAGKDVGYKEEVGIGVGVWGNLLTLGE